MKRKLIFIIVGALVVLGLIIFVWFWFFGQGSKSPEDFGFFNTASSTGTTGTGTLSGGNQQTPFGQNTAVNSGGSVNIQTPLTTYTVGGQTGGVAPPITITVTTTTVTGITWLDGSGGGTGSTKTFTPTPINQINNVGISGTGYFNNADGQSGPGLLETLVGTGVAGAIACTLGLLSGGIGGTTSALLNPTNILPAVYVKDLQQEANSTSDQIRENFLNCIARTIARSVIQQVTASVVDWINSGFDGKPAFVQDYKQFFTNVADRAAGEFIQGSDLAFLCSPFKLQVRIAIAQSYARRSTGASQACTLSDAVGNIENFMNGNFSEGGWPGLISFTTVPTNNPFGGYAYGQLLLNDKILKDT